VVKQKRSHTGRYLAEALAKRPRMEKENATKVRSKQNAARSSHSS